MDLGAGFFQGVRQLVQLIVNRLNIETLGRQLFRNGRELVPRLVHVRDRFVKILGGRFAFRIAFGKLAVAIRAQSARSGGQHLVARFLDGVIAMALAAFGPAMLIEGLLVFAAIEEARVG